MMVKLLGFDTSTEACSVAIKLGDRQAQRYQIAPRQHAELVLTMVESLFRELDCQLTDLDVIAFGQGPGSFMGVRTAAAIAQGLAFAAECPVIAVSTLQALAQQAYMAYHYEHVITAWDARIGEVYWASYQLDVNQFMQAIVMDSIAPPEVLRAFLQSEQCSNVKYACVGNAFSVYHQSFSDVLESSRYFIDMNQTLYPTAEAIVLLGEQAYLQNKGCDAAKAQPIYLRHPVAKEPSRNSL